MCKPQWKDAPDWANFMAQDENGRWFWYSERPLSRVDRWIVSLSGRLKAVPVINWEDSLQERFPATKQTPPPPKNVEPPRETTGPCQDPEDLLQEVFDNAPDWAIVLCQDTDGDWFAYDILPSFSEEDGYWKIPAGLRKLPNMKYIGTTKVIRAGAHSFKLF